MPRTNRQIVASAEFLPETKTIFVPVATVLSKLIHKSLDFPCELFYSRAASIAFYADRGVKNTVAVEAASDLLLDFPRIVTVSSSDSSGPIAGRRERAISGLRVPKGN
jgi:hypothetical protein